MHRRALILFFVFSALGALLLVALGTRVAGIPPMGALLDPANGLYRTARLADAPPPTRIHISEIEDSIRVVWDDRRVPHIFAQNGLDAVAALGYIEATERLFQVDFIPRAASGRLSETLGSGAVEVDQFLRRTGMEWGARQNLARIEAEAGIEMQVLDAYCAGVNAYLDDLETKDLPFEFRLLGYEPDPCTRIQPLRVLQYMNFDLSYQTDNAEVGWLRERLSEADFRLLYPFEPEFSIPIIPSPGGQAQRRAHRVPDAAPFSTTALQPSTFGAVSSLLEGYRPGKGSNNWAVSAARSTTGAPILAGDMHLSVTLPAIWFEVHVVTPEMNVYGVTIPGSPLPVEAFNEHLGWTFTNTGSDQIDHYLLEVDSSATRYRYEGSWRDLQMMPDTIRVNGGEAVIDTLTYSHWGPAAVMGGEWIAQQWVAHDSSRTLRALWQMLHAENHDEFQAALRYWDTPMQNILYADRAGTISIRSTGHMPIRRGGTGLGLLDGTSARFEWIGRIPFEELPFANNPGRGFLTSTNQKPTGASYPYYFGGDWEGRTYRSIRADSLLRAKERHGVDDFKRYQGDVHAVQRDFFVPLLDTLAGLTGRADSLRRMLVQWDGEMALNRPEPVALHYYLTELRRLTWDEKAFDPVRYTAGGDTLSESIRLPLPAETRIYHLLTTQPTSPFLDIQSTDVRENGADLMREALRSAARKLEDEYGWDSETWLWQNRHKLRFNHLISALESLGRGPAPYPGYDETLSPAADTLATHSASWRVIVDFSTSPPHGVGVYPGGQSGNPFSAYYDRHISTYLRFRYYDLLNPSTPSDIDESLMLHRSVIHPGTNQSHEPEG